MNDLENRINDAFGSVVATAQLTLLSSSWVLSGGFYVQLLEFFGMTPETPFARSGDFNYSNVTQVNNARFEYAKIFSVQGQNDYFLVKAIEKPNQNIVMNFHIYDLGGA